MIAATDLRFPELAPDARRRLAETPAAELRRLAAEAPEISARLFAIAEAIEKMTPRPSRDARLAARDHYIRQALEKSPGENLSRRADCLEKSLNRYLASRWRVERDSGPKPGASEYERLLFRVVDLNEGRSLSSRQIRNIAADHRG